jgi:hypothetical protein
MKQLSGLWHSLIGDQKFIEAADYYAQRVRTMLDEEARITQTSQGPFSSDTQDFLARSGKLIGAGMYDDMSPSQVTEQQKQREYEIAYGNRIGLHIATLCFRQPVNSNSVRRELDDLVGKSPNLVEDGINTSLYVLPAPRVFLAEGHKHGYGVVCSGRTNNYRAHKFESRVRALIENATATLQEKYGDNLLVKTMPQGYMPSFLMPNLAKALQRKGIKLPSTG